MKYSYNPPPITDSQMDKATVPYPSEGRGNGENKPRKQKDFRRPHALSNHLCKVGQNAWPKVLVKRLGGRALGTRSTLIDLLWKGRTNTKNVYSACVK